MRRALCESLPAHAGQSVELSENEGKHLVSVLRMRNGDELELLDGNGHRANARLMIQGKKILAVLAEAPQTQASLLSKPIHLSMAMIKNEAMEWVIEKAVELGVRTLTPIESEFTVIRAHKKGEDVFRERYQRIADQALKQCGRLDRLEILTPQTFEQVLLNKNHLIWLDETLANSAPVESHLAHFLKITPKTETYELLVGPEGGFSPMERQRLLTAKGNGAITRVHLGSIILRAETAALSGICFMGEHL